MALNVGVVSIALIAASLPSLAQTPAPVVPADTPAPTVPAAPSGLCYEVVAAAINAVPYAPILLDRCSGRSWLLAADRGVDAQGKPTGAFAFRWHPLGNTADEAVLAFPEQPKLTPGSAPGTNAGSTKKPAVR